MKLPPRITVLSEVYKVKWKRGLAESQGADGMCDPMAYTIYLDASLKTNPRALKRIFWHEVGHAFCFESGLHENLPLAGIEMYCQAFSGFMCQNWKILKF